MNSSLKTIVALIGCKQSQRRRILHMMAWMGCCSASFFAQASEHLRADALLQIDLNRAAVVERIVTSWHKEIPARQVESFKAKLMRLRADQLLAVNVSGSFDGVLAVLDAREQAIDRGAREATLDTAQAQRADQAKLLGDIDRDVVYTPITPCRLIDTRGVFSPVFAGGAFAGGETRAYQTTGNCTVPAGAQAVATQIIMITPTAAGDIELLPQGATFGSTVAMVFQANQYSSVSAITRLNSANGQFETQIRGPGGHVAIDITGYFVRAQATPLECVSASGGGGQVPANASAFFNNTTCPTGYRAVTPYCFTAADGVYLQGVGFNGNNPNQPTLCAWRNTTGAAVTVNGGNVCCRIPGR